MKRFFSWLLVLCITLGIILNPNIVNDTYVSAASSSTKAVNNAVYYIQHVGSGKYLDVTSISSSNGARLQIWSKASNHQNQVFHFTQVGNNYWKITAWHSKKAIEVRDSSKSNNAHVSQWDYAGLACQQWKIVYNSDGTVSFQNRNSGKYLDVCQNSSKNGTKIIQYSRNKTTAQKFKLYRISTKDVLNTTWTRTFSNSDIKWNQYSITSNTFNSTRFTNKAFKYPTPGCSYLYKIEYIDANTVHNMLVKKSLNSSTLSQIKQIIKDEGKSSAAEALLKKMGYDVPGIGIAFGVLETLATSESKSEWNKFAKTTRSGKGIVKYTYITITTTKSWGPLANGKTSFGWRYYITEHKTYSYSVWNGTNISYPSNYSGHIDYTFK